MQKSFQTREQQFVQRCETKVGADACKGSKSIKYDGMLWVAYFIIYLNRKLF